MDPEQEQEGRECFAKQLEISSVFSYDFDKYDESNDILTNCTDPK